MAARVLPHGSSSSDGGNDALLMEIKELLTTQTQAIASLQNEMAQLRSAVQASDGTRSATRIDHSVLPAPAPLKSSKTSGTKSDRFLSAALKRSFPLYVLPIKTFLSPSFQMLRPHEELRDAGALVEWTQGMAPVLFVSHTWLRHRHPDSAAQDKFRTLTRTLQRIVEGDLTVSCGWLIKFIYGKDAKAFCFSAAQLQRDLSEGYLFLDFMSIPQAPEASDAQQRAIASLVSYVSDARYFMVLAGGWFHEDGSARDEMAWNERGWCRMELVANALSPTSKPMIVCRSASAVEAFPPGGQMMREWLHDAIVGLGKFTVDADRLKLAPHLMHLISARKAQALAEDDFEFFRVLHARAAMLLAGTGLSVPEEPFQDWMATMRFESVNDSRTTTGITPLLYAAMAGRKDIVAALLDRGADLHAACKVNRPKFTVMKGLTVLGAAVGMTDDPELVQMLMQHGADPRAPCDAENGSNALLLALCGSNRKVAQHLIEHDRTLLDQRNKLEELPLANAAFFGKTEVVSWMKEQYPDELRKIVRDRPAQWGGGRIAGALANNAGNLEMIKMLIEAGEDVTLSGPARGKLRMIIKFCTFARRFTKLSDRGMVIGFAYGCCTPALTSAASSGNPAVMKLLLAQGADVDSVGHNPRRWTALHMAAWGGHDDCVRVLLASGARTDLKDSAGRTPADIAKQVGNREIRQMLISSSTDARKEPVPPVTTFVEPF